MWPPVHCWGHVKSTSFSIHVYGQVLPTGDGWECHMIQKNNNLIKNLQSRIVCMHFMHEVRLFSLLFCIWPKSHQCFHFCQMHKHLNPHPSSNDHIAPQSMCQRIPAYRDGYKILTIVEKLLLVFFSK